MPHGDPSKTYPPCTPDATLVTLVSKPCSDERLLFPELSKSSNPTLQISQQPLHSKYPKNLDLMQVHDTIILKRIHVYVSCVYTYINKQINAYLYMNIYTCIRAHAYICGCDSKSSGLSRSPPAPLCYIPSSRALCYKPLSRAAV